MEENPKFPLVTVGLARTIQYAAANVFKLRRLRLLDTRLRGYDGLQVPPLQHAILRRDDIAARADRRAVHVEKMRKRRPVAGGPPPQRTRLVLRPLHHHTVHRPAVPAIAPG